MVGPSPSFLAMPFCPTRLLSFVLLVLALLVLPLCMASPGGAGTPGGKRLALVVASGAYRQAALPAAPLDGGLVAAALADDGFAVTAMLDPDKERLDKGLAIFSEKVRQAGPSTLVFIYLEGHALQYGGEAYLLPASARIGRQTDVPVEGIPLSKVTAPLQSLPAVARIFVFNLAQSPVPSTAEPLPLAAGLPLPQISAGSLYALNAAPDAASGPDVPLYGRYARALDEALRQPGLSPSALFERVRMRVAAASGGLTIPWSSSAIDETLRIGPPGDEPAPAEGQPTPETAFWMTVRRDRLEDFETFLAAHGEDRVAPRVRGWLALRREATIWQEVRNADRPEAYWTFMRLYPRGPHYIDVRRRLAALGAALAPPPRFDPYPLTSGAPPEGEWRLLDKGQPSGSDAEEVPPPPADMVRPPPRDIWLDLPPPLPLPRGVLPVPPPFAPAAREPGVIEQILVPGLGTVRFQRDGRALPSHLLVESDAGPVVRWDTRDAAGGWEAVERDAADEPQARLTLRQIDAARTVVVETDARGAYLADLRTSVDPVGGSRAVLRDARLRLVFDVRRDRWGDARHVVLGAEGLRIPPLDVPGEPEAPPAPAKPNAPPAKQTEPPAAAPPPASPAPPGDERLGAPLPVPRPSDLPPTSPQRKRDRN